MKTIVDLGVCGEDHSAVIQRECEKEYKKYSEEQLVKKRKIALFLLGNLSLVKSIVK